MGLSSWLKKLGLAGGITADGIEPLTDNEQLEAALQSSARQPVFIYKHSPICAVSSFAYRQVVGFLESAEPKPAFYFIDVLGARIVSDEVASRLDVAHQSPQLLLIRDGRVLWQASHGEIQMEAIGRAFAAA